MVAVALLWPAPNRSNASAADETHADASALETSPPDFAPADIARSREAEMAVDSVAADIGNVPAKNKAPPAAVAQEVVKKAPAKNRTRGQSVFERPAEPASQGRIDELVFARWQKLAIQPAYVCSDEVFVRRVYLDVIGTLPTAEEARRFLQDHSSEKRRALIDRLLERAEYADYWAMKWSDLLRVKAEFPINLWPNAAQAYHRWIRHCLKQNMPYDRFVRELLTASGSNFRVPQVNFYRALQSREPPVIAQTVALTFLGERAEAWPKERLAGMATFFAQVGYKSTAEWKEEIVFFDLDKAKAASANPAARFPDGTPTKLLPEQDPRAAFADWLIDPKQTRLARPIVNRVWYWLVGRGIIHEPDDIRPDNPAQDPELLAWLAAELVRANYDLKHIYRLILNSQTYQLSCVPRADHAPSAANFAHYPLRRLDAEVLIDALCQITGTTEKYSSPIPEPFTFIPDDFRSIALPDGSITSSFLEMFGRPPRDTGMESERINRLTAAQRLHLLNSSHIRRKFEQGGKFKKFIQAKGKSKATAEELYLTILSRFPTAEELAAIGISGDSGNAQSFMDVAWALVNSTEFLHRH